MNRELLNIVRKFNKKRILLIGDFMIDKYIHGNCQRIAPEASVPVIDIHEKHTCLGGAANVAANLSALGAKVMFCTVTGKDGALTEALHLLKTSGIADKYLIADVSRKTIIKTRISSESQLIVRFDEGTDSKINAATEARLIKHIENAYKSCDAILISDYNKGVITDRVISKLLEWQRLSKKLLMVDAKSYERYRILKPDFIKPNYQEALKITGELYAQSRKEQVKKWGALLAAQTGAANIVLTMDKDGIAHFGQSDFISHYEVEQVVAPQVSGAGDSFISAFLLSVLSGANANDAIALAVHAAHAAIQKRKKTAICTPEDIEEKLVNSSKHLSLVQLRKLVAKHRKEGKKIVFTNGCFDILHCGHVKYLSKAKEQGDILIVGINNDESIKRLKGSARPINNLLERVEVLNGLASIDYIVTFGKKGDDTPIQLIKALKPHVFVKGGDYSYKYLPEKVIIDEIGCRLELIPFTDNKSTSSTIKRIQDNIKTEVYAS
ncbi:D-glycero-beta-D-manno-heptose 1-phosphate adenylyltransferase [Pseudopedobacter sp.]|uniref:D-glycero-beta-D-manno-heptose 1-phosphate adenylyltransferase n=1 Tax=Pseudopedobacter sp. TaxID=1936787 RepID=UPI00333FE915